MEDLKDIMKGVAICVGVVFAILVVISLLTMESDSAQATRRSKECAAQGYNGIQAKHTKEGDLYYICVNYPE